MTLRPFDYFVVAVGATLAAAVGVSHRSTPLAAVSLALLVLVAAWLSVIDFRHHRLPNRIVGPLAAAVTVGLLIASVATDDVRRALIATGFGLALATVLLILSLLGDLGMGDVKFAYPIGAVLGWFGWNTILIGVLVTSLTGALVGVAVLAAGKGAAHRLSYGPYMALGLAAALLQAA